MSRKPGKPPPSQKAGPAAPPTSPGLIGSLLGRDWCVGLLIAGAALLAYWPALHAGFVWDDDAHVTRPDLVSLHGLWRIWSELGATQQYYPFLHSAFWLEHRLWGDAPLGYHLANVLLHAAVAWLLYRVLRRLSLPGALFAALAFCLHPVCAESVAWISEQKNTLSAVFYLAAALAYLRFDRDRRGGWYAFALGFFALALATKTVTATLPAALLVVLWWKKGRLSWTEDILPVLPLLLLGVAAGLGTALVERTYIGARGAAFDLTAADRFLVAGRAACFYLGKIFWPSGLVFIYPHWDIDDRVPWQYLFPAAVALAFAILFAVRARWRGPLASALLFVGTLFPALGFINVYPFIYSYVADHFQYLAAAFAISAAVAALASIPWPAGARRHARGAGAMAAAAILVVLAGMTRRQCLQYADAETLWRATLAKNPGCGMARGNLGGILMKEGRVDLALAQFQAALAIRQYSTTAEAHYNLACALEATPGRSGEAIAQFEEALRLRPDYPEAHYDLGRALETEPGHLAQAIAHYQQALRAKPDYVAAHYSLGVAFQATPGRLNEAIAEYGEALRLDPELFQAHYSLAFALGALPGRQEDAIAHYKEALHLRPDSAEAHFNLACILQAMPGGTNEAVAHYEASLRLKPGNAEAHSNLANALNALGRTPEAIAHYEKALLLEPDNPIIHLNFGIVLLNIPGRTPEAAAQFNEVERLQPGNETARRILTRINPPKAP